jgi:hypothetical protein
MVLILKAFNSMTRKWILTIWMALVFFQLHAQKPVSFSLNNSIILPNPIVITSANAESVSSPWMSKRSGYQLSLQTKYWLTEKNSLGLQMSYESFYSSLYSEIWYPDNEQGEILVVETNNFDTELIGFGIVHSHRMSPVFQWTSGIMTGIPIRLHYGELYRDVADEYPHPGGFENHEYRTPLQWQINSAVEYFLNPVNNGHIKLYAGTGIFLHKTEMAYYTQSRLRHFNLFFGFAIELR